MSESVDCYEVDTANRELRQSEIISGLKLPVFVASEANFELVDIGLAIVMTQDCDLLREYDERSDSSRRVLSQILLYEVEEAENARAIHQLNSKLWDPVSKNANERFHLLSAFNLTGLPKESSLPAMLIDFRRHFTMDGREIARQIAPGQNAKRRCFLKSPYREHLQSRAAYYFARVGLPFNHQS